MNNSAGSSCDWISMDVLVETRGEYVQRIYNVTLENTFEMIYCNKPSQRIMDDELLSSLEGIAKCCRFRNHDGKCKYQLVFEWEEPQ